jgi:hypothetical protein
MSDKKQFTVTVSRTTYATKDYAVMAYTEDDAKDAAIVAACNDEWKSGNAEYEVDGIEAKEEAIGPQKYEDIAHHVDTLLADGILVSLRLDSGDNELYEIQAGDEAGYFATDPDAWKFMLAKANAGNEAYGQVLKFIEGNNPEEFARIVSVGEWSGNNFGV